MKPIRTKAAMTLTVAMLLGAPGLQATAPAPAAPAAAGDDMSLADLLNIKLQTGSFLELDLAKSPLSMTIIDREKIDMAGANHLSELLEIYVPGFQYMYNKWNGALWGMRGVTNDRNTKFIVLVNGHKLNTESRDGFMQETAMGLFGDVERIEVLRGPAGLVYGSGAIAGVVNIVTREVTKTGAELAVKGRTWTTGFGNTAKSIQGTVFGKISEVQSFRASLGMEQSDGVGMHVAQLMGSPSWPSQGIVQKGGSPSNGSALATPGNWKADADWKYKDFRLYTRFTHQVQEGSAHFAQQPWPNLVNVINEKGDCQKKLDDTISRPTAAEAAKLRDRIAYLNTVIAGAPKVLINGKAVSPDDPYWSGIASGGTNNRREYIADGIVLESNYTINFGDNQLKLRAGVDGVTNKIGVQDLPGYDNSVSQVQTIEDFGERRYTLGALYLMKSIPKLQLAVGAEQRFDDLGNGLDGNNMENEVPLHVTVTPELYTNTAIFSEGFYDINDLFSVDAGLRWDGHTRTIDQGGTINGKLAGIYTPAQGHSIKLIFQSSSNNGAVDNYEPNRFQMDDKGYVYPTPHFQTPSAPGNANNQPIPGVTLTQGHDLKPEKTYSFELTSTDAFSNGFTVAPSLSYNIIQDLFIWNQGLLRVVNAGGFNSMNFDLEGSYKNKWIEVGANHTAQYVVNTDVADQAVQIPVDFVANDVGVQQPDGTYIPTPGKTSVVTVNPIRDAITVDGTNFLSLSTHTTKLFVNYKPLSNITLHSDVRVFWGLAGRDSIFSADEKNGFEFLDISRSPSTKWNASLHVALPESWTVALYAYDILGVNDYKDGGALATNTLRWQQAYGTDAKDIFTQDLRSYAIELKKAF
ncbi:MAG: TonB-dependent receptor plug domain-containing protein [Fibrobacteres bacterium]|nr:TonB-dependent receptor plug domain-containing protein [Fibrobacterota bacterium]